jgi:hypothetical protein
VSMHLPRHIIIHKRLHFTQKPFPLDEPVIPLQESHPFRRRPVSLDKPQIYRLPMRSTSI